MIFSWIALPDAKIKIKSIFCKLQLFKVIKLEYLHLENMSA